MLMPIDWVIIVVYLVGCTIAGLWMRRYVRNVDDFAVAARAMEVNLGVASLAATEVGIVTVMYTAQMGFTNGFAGATTGIVTAIAMLIVGITGFVIVPLRNAGVMTIPELFEKRFGKDVRWLAGLVVILGGVLNMGVFLRVGGDFLMNICDLRSETTFTLSLLGAKLSIGYLEMIMTGLLVVVLVYTVLGGMLSVLITDYLQFLVMGLGIVVTSVLVVWSLGWPNLVDGLGQAHDAAVPFEESLAQETKRDKEAAKQMPEQAAKEFLKKRDEAQQRDLVASSKELAQKGILVSQEKNEPVKALTMAQPYNPFVSRGQGVAWVVWQTIMAFAVVTTWQTTIARVLAARDSNTAKRVYRGTWFYFVGRWCLPGLWGAAAFYYFAHNGGLPEGINSLTAMPLYLNKLLSGVFPGLLGLMIAAMLAAEMSTDSGYLLTWATVIYNDLISPVLRRPLSSRAKLLVVRLVVVAIGAFLVFWGLWYKPPGSIWEYLSVTGNIYLASLFALLVGGLYWRGANRWGALSAIVLGAAGPVAFLVVNFFVEPDSPYHIPGEVSGLAAFGLSFAGMFVGSLVGTALGRGRPAASLTKEEAAS
jgi:Na+/proline symporter